MKQFKSLKSYLAKAWYKSTAHFPRRIPKSLAEVEEMSRVMHLYLGLEDGLDVWYTVLSQTMSGDPTSLRKSYASMVNAGNKLRISGIIQAQKSIAHNQHMDMLKSKLEVATEKLSNELKEEITGTPDHHADLQDWTHDIQGNVPTVPELEARMVNEGGVQRF